VKPDIGKNVAVFCGLVTLAVGTRLLMIEPNFHAVTAAALFAGFYFRRFWTAACVPLVAMTASDWVIGGYALEVMAVVYASMVLPILWRGLLRSRLTPARVVSTAAISTILFYLTTNAAVWHAASWYPRTTAGLAQCYYNALPFLANALAGDVLFAGVLFGAYALARERSGPARCQDRLDAVAMA
jgi:hypothetical protein